MFLLLTNIKMHCSNLWMCLCVLYWVHSKWCLNISISSHYFDRMLNEYHINISEHEDTNLSPKKKYLLNVGISYHPDQIWTLAMAFSFENTQVSSMFQEKQWTNWGEYHCLWRAISSLAGVLNRSLEPSSVRKEKLNPHTISCFLWTLSVLNVQLTNVSEAMMCGDGFTA